MLGCEQFRFLTGADPGHLSCALRLHRLICLGCARYLRQMRKLDRRIRQALLLPDPTRSITVPPGAATTDEPDRGRLH